MDDKNILIASRDSYHHFHGDRSRKRHLLVFLMFVFVILFSYLLILVSVQTQTEIRTIKFSLLMIHLRERHLVSSSKTA